jgi:hypothetical protein
MQLDRTFGLTKLALQQKAPVRDTTAEMTAKTIEPVVAFGVSGAAVLSTTAPRSSNSAKSVIGESLADRLFRS